MSDKSDLWEGARHGAGWALGFGSVLGAGTLATRGAGPALKTLFKGVLRARQAGAELTERMQDLYAEAESEYAAEMAREEDV